MVFGTGVRVLPSLSKAVLIYGAASLFPPRPGVMTRSDRFLFTLSDFGVVTSYIVSFKEEGISITVCGARNDKLLCTLNVFSEYGEFSV